MKEESFQLRKIPPGITQGDVNGISSFTWSWSSKNGYCKVTVKLLDTDAPLSSVAVIVTVTVPIWLGNLEICTIPAAFTVAVAVLPSIEETEKVKGSPSGSEKFPATLTVIIDIRGGIIWSGMGLTTTGGRLLFSFYTSLYLGFITSLHRAGDSHRTRRAING